MEFPKLRYIAVTAEHPGIENIHPDKVTTGGTWASVIAKAATWQAHGGNAEIIGFSTEESVRAVHYEDQEVMLHLISPGTGSDGLLPPNENYFSGAGFQSIKRGVQRRAQAAIENGEFPVVHAHYWVGAAALRAARTIDAVTIFTPDMLGAIKENNQPGYRDDHRWETEREATIKSDLVTVNTAYEKDWLMTYLADDEKQEVAVSPPGVDHRKFSPEKRRAIRQEARRTFGIEPNEFVFACIGRVAPMKNFEAAIDGFSQYIRRTHNEHATLLLTIGEADKGHNAYRSQLHDQIAALPADVRNKIRPIDIQSDPMWAYGSADAVIVPSHFETFGMVALEAMACKLPVIINNIPPLLEMRGYSGEAIESSEALVFGDDLRSGRHIPLDHCMDAIVRDDVLREETARRLYQRSTSYTWDQTVGLLKLDATRKALRKSTDPSMQAYLRFVDEAWARRPRPGTSPERISSILQQAKQDFGRDDLSAMID